MKSMTSNEGVLNPKYQELVYSGVLGKIIGVYSGRPFEGWSHERILKELGEVDRYVASELNVPLVVSDDDISGTFTFLRSLSDNNDDPNLTAAQIGETWLNYLIEEQNVLWWGGIGVSTEHTAYLRLKAGVHAPASGSIALNGKTVAEQIGGQIFIDGWGMIHPGDPVSAADFARRAASVSHDGEGIYGAQVVAALVAQAFEETDLVAMLDTAVALIPASSTIARMIGDIKDWHAAAVGWREAFQLLKNSYGYDKYGGGCHMVPNHGIVVLALLFGDGDFSRSLMIANACGWDTDCNSGNVGCILGIRNGLAGINGSYDWRGPVRDRLFLPTADGGRCVTDAVQEANEIVRMGHAIRSLRHDPPKQGARFSFAFPGSVQGFEGNGLHLDNRLDSLTLTMESPIATALTPSFPNAAERGMAGYRMSGCPTLYPGQTISAMVSGATATVEVAIQIETLAGEDSPKSERSNSIRVNPGEARQLNWTVPPLDGYPVTDVGIHLNGEPGIAINLEWLTWAATPSVTLEKMNRGSASKEAWVSAVDGFHVWPSEPFLIQNEGTGLLIQGCRDWEDYSVETTLTPVVADDFGVAARIQGLRRYYALRLTRARRVQLVKCLGEVTVLAEADFEWDLETSTLFRLDVRGPLIAGYLNGTPILEFRDDQATLWNGAAGVILTAARVSLGPFKISGNNE